MTFLEAVAAFAVVAGLLTVIPGLDTTLVLRTTLSRSRSHGIAAALGIQAGTLVWGAAAATGAAALLAASQTAYRVLTLLGAAYLVWLGVSMLWSSRPSPTAVQRPADAAPDTVGARPGVSRAGVGRSFVTGAATNLMNPKVGAFYVATIPQFVPDGVSPLVMGLVLAGVHCAMGLTWLAAIVAGAELFGPRLRSSHALRWVDRVTGGVLIALGVRVAASARA